MKAKSIGFVSLLREQGMDLPASEEDDVIDHGTYIAARAAGQFTTAHLVLDGAFNMEELHQIVAAFEKWCSL